MASSCSVRAATIATEGGYVTKNADKTRALLFDAALELIGEQGFTGTTVDQIVERAGVAKGTVYYHFRSKAELVDALIGEHLAPLSERLSAAAATATEPTEQLAALVRAELEFIRDDRAFAKLLITEMWREDRVWRETLVMLSDRALAVLRKVIAAGVASGDFSADLDVRLAASAVFGLVATTALAWFVAYPDRDIEMMAPQVERLAVGAVRG
ncbi:MAG: TetR/AcrR family transcriptional regulator [Actinobacteria bacterium]|nr:MAG: TetR/AcrR family transcriptional regulator [Actinomycetota bacterium]